MPAINPAADQVAIIILLADMLAAFSLERLRLKWLSSAGWRSAIGLRRGAYGRRGSSAAA